MPEGGDWLFNAIEALRQDQRDALNQMRLDMNRGFDQIRDEMQLQNGRVRKSEERITVIETQRTEEDKQTMKRGGLAGLVTSGGVIGLIEVVKAWIKP